MKQISKTLIFIVKSSLFTIKYSIAIENVLKLLVQYDVEVYVRGLIDKSLPSVFGRLRDV